MEKNHGLNSIYKKTNLIQLASEILARILPEDLMQHCFVANIQYGLITLSAESAAWSTHLRYYHQQILQGLHERSEFKHIHSIRLRLAKLNAKKINPKPSHPLTMSKDTSNTILATADSVTNSKLKDALLRLAKHGA